MYVCCNPRTCCLWHDLYEINAHFIFPLFPISSRNCCTNSIKRNKVKAYLGLQKAIYIFVLKPTVGYKCSQTDPQLTQSKSRLYRLSQFPSASLQHPRSSAQLYHTAVAQFITIRPIFLIRKLFPSLLSACFSHSAFSSISPMFPCERLKLPTMLLKLMATTSWLYYPHSLSIIDTHMHACFSASLPCCIWTSSVKVFGWNGRWMGPNVLLHAFELTTTPPFSLHITNALPHYCHHCHSNTKNIWAPATSPQHRAKNSVCSSLLLRVRPTGVVKKRCKAWFQTTYGSQILLIKLKLSLLLCWLQSWKD